MIHEYIIELQETNNGESFIEVPEKILNELNLEDGDTLVLSRDNDSSCLYVEKKLS
ncbi:hypothetical protein AB4166_23915 [Vibrio splendidus]|uniref:hypothetical protein n=1 Tax=Vibrio splendidus TaxID=29497 RepID=UPI0012FFED41|nr:hypothetical protein [Vibrio splendidus]